MDKKNPLRWAKIKPGTFRMGESVGSECLKMSFYEPDNKPHWDEAPAHETTISYPFLMSSAPVTNSHFAEFCPSHRGKVQERGLEWDPEAPVELVTWHDAVAFCMWLSGVEGTSYRLPTEAEWEYVARQADKLVLEGMHGETYEWCHDCWGPYPETPQKDPVGSAGGEVRVIRGGRPSDRGGSVPGDRRPQLGFRVVQAPLPDTTPLPSPEPAIPFRDVSMQKKDWVVPSAGERPFFSGGSHYILPPDDPERLPYFGRHHVPSLVWCDNGDLLATAFTAPFDRSRQMAILFTRLRDGGTQWDPPARFFVAPNRNITSAAFYRSSDGQIHHYNGLGGFADSVSTAFSMLKRTSQDNGASWDELRLVNEYPAHRATPDDLEGQPRLWPHMDIVTLADGTMVMPSDSGPGEKSGSVGTVLFESRDGGDTWSERTRFGWNPEEYARPDGQAGWIAGIHAPFVVLGDGRWLALGRNSNIDGMAPWSLSSDEGRTWKYFRSDFPPLHSGHRPVMLRLQQGPILLISFTGPPAVGAERVPIELTDAAGKKRSFLGMFAALSYDEGETWPRLKMIPIDPKIPDESQDGGYLSCVQTPDHAIHLLSSRRYYCFNLAWLEIPHPAEGET